MCTPALETHSIVPVAAAVVLQGNQTTGPFVVAALSPSAVTLEGPSFGNLSLGKAVIVLTLPGRKDMLRLQGTVAHSQWRDGYCMGASVRLEDVDPDVEDQIQEIITRHLERSHMPMVVVLDTGRLERLGIQRFLATLDRDVVFAHSSLDALWLLERFRANYGTILVDQSFIEENGAGILLFLHDQYLDKRRVLVVPRFETIQADLSTTVWAVHGVLTTPWTRAQVEAALGLFPAQRSERPKRILFVDDEPAVLSGLQHRLRKYLPQYETVWVTSGEVAVSESKARPFDVVVTDLRMPGMDGIALLRAIKAQSPRSKRVVLSGLDTHAAKEVADVVLHKPCSVDSLRLEVFGAA